MTFFEFKPGEIISTVYTAYPTRSFNLRIIDGVNYQLLNPINIYFSGDVNNVGTGQRTFEDSNGDFGSNNFYLTATVNLYGSSNTTITSKKRSLFTLRNMYASRSFHKPENYGSSSYGGRDTDFDILDIPSFVVGSGIKPGSFSIQATTTNGFMKLVDDGYGGIYGSSGLSSSILFGCIYYEYGIVQFTASQKIGGNPYGKLFTTDDVYLYFSATNNVPMNVYLCNSPKSMLNFSNNPSYTVLSGSVNEITTENPQTFITTVGLYNEEFELMGVAKVSSPIRNKESDSVQFRLKLNF